MYILGSKEEKEMSFKEHKDIIVNGFQIHADDVKQFLSLSDTGRDLFLTTAPTVQQKFDF